MNMTPENRTHFKSEKEVIHLILTGIGDKIYLTVDACQTAQEIWEAIERLQQSESLNIQDVKTNLFWDLDEDSDPEQAQRDKDMQKNLALIEKYFKKIYKPTNNNLRTSSNTRNKNIDTTPRMQNTDEEINEQRVEAIKVYMDSPGRLYANSDTDAEPLETVETGDSNVLPDSPDMYDNDIQDDQNDVECDDERVALANLIANLKLDVDENKKI
ncbi:hypothetical protein Tco_1070811 [Tanacetum coccineum]|uniref:Uncharacterized protein n=1 Tax=Tanacetum coccineum TaxID=301880 RepID=A0ABQ5GYC6_9ASTR